MNSFLFKSLSKRVRVVMIIALFFSTIFNNVYAQKVWSLQECIKYALDNNITIKQTEIASKISEVSYNQNKMTMLPSLNGSGSYSYNFGRSVDPFTNDFTNQEIQSSNVSLNSNLTLFDGFQLQNSLRQSKYEFLAGKEDLQKIKNDVSLNVAAAYLQVLYAKEALKAANDRSTSATETRNRTKIMVDAGSMAQGSLLDAEAALAAEELDVINMENQLRSSMVSLTQLLELKNTEGFDVEQPKVDLPDQASLALGADEIYNTSLKVLPEIKASEYKVSGAEKSLLVTKGSRLPRLSLFGSLSTGYSNASTRLVGNPIFLGFNPNGSVTSNGDAVLVPTYDYNSEKVPFNDQFNQNLNKSVGISLSIPIFNGWSTESNIKRSALNLENVKYSDQLTRNQLYKSIVQAHLDASSAMKKYYAAEKNATASAEAFSYADKKYNVGMMSSLDYLNARNTKTKAESDFLQAKYDLIFRLKVIDFYMGKQLDF